MMMRQSTSLQSPHAVMNDDDRQDLFGFNWDLSSRTPIGKNFFNSLSDLSLFQRVDKYHPRLEAFTNAFKAAGPGIGTSLVLACLEDLD
jgi:hypothetical protein